MRCQWNMAAVGIWLLTLAGAGAQPAPAVNSAGLDDVRKQFAGAFADLPRQERAAAQQVRQRYLDGLAALEEALQLQGNAMPAVLTVRAERERFEQAGTIPDAVLAGRLPALRKLQDEWRAQSAALPLTAAQRLVALTERYLQSLANLQTALTVIHDTNGITAVKAEKDRLLDNHRVREAIALLQAAKAPARAGGGAPVYLCDLPEQEVHVGFGNFGKRGELGYEGLTISVNGQPSPHGLSMHPPYKGSARVKYDLAGRYATLSGAAAINDEARQIRSALTFRIVGDGRELWRSQPLRRGREEFNVSLRGVRKLELCVDCPGLMADAHAVWVEPRLR